MAAEEPSTADAALTNAKATLLSHTLPKARQRTDVYTSLVLKVESTSIRTSLPKRGRLTRFRVSTTAFDVLGNTVTRDCDWSHK